MIIAAVDIILSVLCGVLIYVLFHKPIGRFLGSMEGLADDVAISVILVAIIRFYLVPKSFRFCRRVWVAMKYPTHLKTVK